MIENLRQKRELLTSAYEYLQKFEKGCTVIIELFRQGDDTEALNILTDALDGISWLLDAFEDTSNILDGRVDVIQMTDTLKEIEEALVDIDYIMLADLIEYEIIPKANIWKEQLKNVLFVEVEE